LENPETRRKKQNLLWMIYCLLYSEPKTMYAVSIEIYNRSYPLVGNTIKKYAKKGYFEQIKEKDSDKIKWKSTPTPIIEFINHNNILSEAEKKTLYKFLDSKNFRLFMKRNGGITNMSTILYILSLLSVNALCFSQYLFYSRNAPFRERQEALKELIKIKKRTEAEEQIMNTIRSKVQGYLKLCDLPHYAKNTDVDFATNEKFILEFLTFNDELLIKMARSLNIYDVLVESIAYAFETADLISRKKGFRQ